MSEISKNIVSLIVSKEFHKAKTLIHEAMNNKLGILLEEKLLEYAPTLYEGEDTDRHAETKKTQENEWAKLSLKLSQIAAEKQSKAVANANLSDSVGQKTPNALGENERKAEIERVNKENYAKYLASASASDEKQDSEESPVAERVFKTGKDMTNVATTAWLANQTGVLDGVGRVLPMVKELPIAPAIFPALVAGEALMTLGDIIANPDWKYNKLKATEDAANKIAHQGVRLLAYSNPITGIPSYFDQQFNHGRGTDAVTDALIKGPNDVLDNMGILPDLNDPDAVKKYNNSLIGTISPEHSVQHDADLMSADLKVKRDLRRRGVTQQDTEKPQVAAGTVRNGSGQVMQQ